MIEGSGSASRRNKNMWIRIRNTDLNSALSHTRRKIRHIEGNAKCRHLTKNWPVKGLCGRCFSVWNRTPPPFHTVYVYTVYYTFSHRGVGRVESESRLEGWQFTLLGRKYKHDWLYLRSINSDEHLPQSPFTSKFFGDDDILLWFLYS